MDNRGTALIAVGGGLIIFAIKLGAWYISGSIALLSDVVTSVGVAGGLYVFQLTGWTQADPIIALAVSILIIRMGADIILKSSRALMDDHSPETEKKIEALLDRHRSRFVDYHDIKTRRSGTQVFTELHLSIDGEMTVKEAHDFTDHLEEDLKKEFPDVTVTIHIEPPENHD